MPNFLRNPLTAVWLALSAITVLSWLLGTQSGATSHSANAAITITVLMVALIKVRFVLHFFMEVREAPAWLRRSCDGWLLTLLAGVLALSFSGS